MERLVAELRSEVTGDRLSGHAAVFNQYAKLSRHYEALAPTAFDAVLRNDPDVKGLINHDPSKLLARTSNGSLKLGTDSVGLAFEMELPNTSYANDLRELVARDLLTSMSFGFIPDQDEWSHKEGRQVRTHTSVGALLDVSIVTYPAYSDTSVMLRSVDFSTPAFTAREQLIRLKAAQLLKGVK